MKDSVARSICSHFVFLLKTKTKVSVHFSRNENPCSKASSENLKSFVLIVGILVATTGGVITYRALYVEPRSAVVISETGIRSVPDYKRVIAGALLLVGGAAVAFMAARKTAT